MVGAFGFSEVRDTIARLEVGTELRRSAPVSIGSPGRTCSRRPAGGPTPRWAGTLTATGEETNDEAGAATDEEGNPVPNELRNLWVTATALTTALNTAFLAERIALFSIVIGVALLLTGIGFLVLTISVFLRPSSTPRRSSALGAWGGRVAGQVRSGLGPPRDLEL